LGEMDNLTHQDWSQLRASYGSNYRTKAVEKLAPSRGPLTSEVPLRVWLRGAVVNQTRSGTSDVNTLAKRLLTETEVRAAARSVQIPTKAQTVAGNYQKGHLTVGGLPIAIETPKGRFRRGVGANGRPWAVRMPAHYGYVKGTVGADGDHVDVYLGPLAHEAEQHPVFVVDQVDAKTRRFDEAKCLLGFPDRTAAIAAYDAAFSDDMGMQRRGAVCRMTWQEFRGWLKAGDLTKPLCIGNA
jgi:Inorganic Pyrophosphatase